MPPAGVVLLYISDHDAARIVSRASLIDALTLATALTSATSSSSESLLGRGSAARPPRRSQPSLGGASLAPWNARDRALPAYPLPPPT